MLEREVSSEVVPHPVHATADSARVHVGRPGRRIGNDRETIQIDQSPAVSVLEVKLPRPGGHLTTDGAQQRPCGMDRVCIERVGQRGHVLLGPGCLPFELPELGVSVSSVVSRYWAIRPRT